MAGKTETVEGAGIDSGANMLQPGFVFPDTSFLLSRELQAVKLDCCGIDPALYGDQADPTLLGVATLDAMLAAGISLLGQVHVAQRFHLLRPLRLDETILVQGRVTGTEKTARGTTYSSAFDYRDEKGEVAATATRTSLRPDLAAGKSGPGSKKDKQSDKEPSASNDDAGLSTVFSRTLEPEKVARYSGDAGNLIHSDPDVAREHGFHAPIAAGLIGVHLFTEALARRSCEIYDIDIRFRRPMFWDETLDLEAREEEGRITAMRIINATGRPAVSAVLHATE